MSAPFSKKRPPKKLPRKKLPRGQDSLHAGCISYRGRGVLIFGDAGVGKSSLALRMISEDARQWTMLVADDRTVLERRGSLLYATPPPALAGKMELRNVGILRLPYRERVPLCLALTLLACKSDSPRLPEPQKLLIKDVPLPHFRLPSHDPLLPQKLLHLLLQRGAGKGRV